MMQRTRIAFSPTAKTDIAYAGFWLRFLAYLIDGVALAGVEAALFTSVYVIAGKVDLPGFAGVCTAIGWAYFVLFESSPARGTLGKIALELYVADVHGDPISFWRASLRNALKSVSWLVFGVGWMMAGFTPRKQALHDLGAGTLVLRKVHYFVTGPESPTEPGDHWDGTGWVARVPPMENS
jgi:uncharacterized RDD family membrane protein YckC